MIKNENLSDILNFFVFHIFLQITLECGLEHELNCEARDH